MEKETTYINTVTEENIDFPYSEKDIENAKKVYDEIERYLDGLSNTERDRFVLARFFSSTIFALIVAVVFLVALWISNTITNANIQGIRYLIFNVISNFVLIVSGNISIWMYAVFSNLIQKKIRNNSIREGLTLESETRMWIFLLVFWGYSLFGIRDVRIQSITSVALSLIIGRFFWVDGKLNETIDILKTFGEQPWIIKTLYIISFTLLVCSYINTSRLITAICLIIISLIWIAFSVIREINKWGRHMQKYIKDNNITFDIEEEKN